MNTIKQLIEKYCPEGVEYKKLGEVCTIKGRIGFRGYTRADLVNEGEGAISLSPANIVNGQINYSKCSYVSWDKYYESPEIMIENGDVIFCKTASVGKTCYVDNLPEKATINPQFVVFKEIKIDHKYLSYYVSGSAFQKDIFKIRGLGSIPTLSQKDLANLLIPIPPLPVQREIVRILDNFTSLEAELEKQLEAELEARRKQYEYYLDKIYSISDTTLPVKSLSDYGSFERGKRFVRSDVVEEGYPCIHYGDMYTYYGPKASKTKTFIKPEKAAKLRFAHKGDIIIVGAGENKDDIGVGVAWFGDDAPAIHDACYIYSHSDAVDPM